MKPLNYYIEEIIEARSNGKQRLVGTSIKHPKKQKPYNQLDKELSKDNMDGYNEKSGNTNEN